MTNRTTASLSPARLAGHPIRRHLAMGKHAARSQLPAAPRGEDDLKLFALSFTAFFVCIYTLIF
jgi:hypothetical protein